MRKILLDTNAYTKLLLGEKPVLDELARADLIYLPSIVLGELFAGFMGSSREKKNRKLLEKFLQKPGVKMTPVGNETAEIFGDIKHTLSKNGTPLPINDVWIASCAVETGAVVVTFDNHFSKIPGLRVWGHI
ncbi:MAG: type II toxin-antitoxin system VapC family toxin [Candidatus Blackburnbacteria bacterium]|nr:type II toxin-antitoxin system VapC family toxin [Candidatus Blackburnbacteria bacterium]